MDIIYYRGLKLDVIQSLLWEREPMLDQSNTTYLDTRWRGSVIVSYNPGAISYVPGPKLPTPLPGQFPAETDDAIRRFLEQPRGRLVVQSLGVDVINVPDLGSICDTRNGPFTRVNSIQYIQGERLWKIHLEFETYINETPKISVFLSNRWYSYDDTNWQHLRTRTYQGVITVRGDALQQLPPIDMTNQAIISRYTDSFRNAFAGFSVPIGFQRENVHVVVNPDGNTAHYTVVDVEQLFDKGSNCPAVRIEVGEGNWMWAGSRERAHAQSGVLGAIGNANGMAVDWLLGTNTFQNAGQAAAAAMTGSARANLPKLYRNVIVRCWGNRVTNRVKLVNYGMAVMTFRMGRPFAINTTTGEILVTQDNNNFVQINATINWGGDLAADTIGGGIFGGAVAAIDMFGPGALAGNLLQAQRTFNSLIGANPDTLSPAGAGGNPLSPEVRIQQSSRIANVPFPAAAGTRGTAAVRFPSGNITGAPPPGVYNIPPYSSPPLYVLVTQSLEAFDQPPDAVP